MKTTMCRRCLFSISHDFTVLAGIVSKVNGNSMPDMRRVPLDWQALPFEDEMFAMPQQSPQPTTVDSACQERHRVCTIARLESCRCHCRADAISNSITSYNHPCLAFRCRPTYLSVSSSDQSMNRSFRCFVGALRRILYFCGIERLSILGL